MNNNQNNQRKKVCLQIGGTVGPNDSVGMHVLMPTQPDVDVSRLAKILGGGGHKKAAGFGVEGFEFLKNENLHISNNN